MSNAAKVRAYLEQHGPSKAAPIFVALGMTRAQCHAALSEMSRSGFVETTGPARERVYGRTAKVNRNDNPMTAEQVRQRSIVRLEDRRRVAGSMSRAEYLAQFAGMKSQREYEIQRNARKKAERHAARAANPKTTKATYRKTQNVPLLRVTTPTTVQVTKRDVSADVARWLAAGNAPIQIPAGYVSAASQFKHIDNRGMAA